MTSPVERRVLEAAATWYVQFQSEPPDNAQRQAWLRWLASDPAHQVAWQQMELLQRSLGTLPGQATRQALSASGQRRQVLKLLLLLPAAGLVGWQAQDAVDNWADYRTSTGQQRRIELTDGSRVDLNTDTALDIRFDARQRLIHLRSGEILVRTGKRGDQRPLRGGDATRIHSGPGHALQCAPAFGADRGGRAGAQCAYSSRGGGG